MKEELQKKITRAIRLLQSAEKKAQEFGEPVEICYSGGKDSDVILELAKMSGIKYKAIYKNTTIDPPGTIRHALEMGAEMIRPKKTFFQLMQVNGIPSRFYRFCCSELKEYKVLNVSAIGIRRCESTSRARRYVEPEQCLYYQGKKSERNHVRAFYPILDWTDDDVLEFIEERRIRCAPVYYDDNGKFCVERRLGCMCCPLQSQKRLREEFKSHPKVLRQWINRGGAMA